MAKDALYTLSELAQATGTSPRTVRYYTSEELLPPPPSRGRFALYGMAHVQRLRLIGLLKAALLPLAAIREHLPALSDAQVAALLAQHGANGSALERAADAQAFALPDAAIGTPIETQAEAYRALSHALTARHIAPIGTVTAQETTEADTAKAARPANSKSRRALLVSSRIEAEGEETSVSPYDPLTGSRGSDTWQRILLAPGVELHVRTPDSPQSREHLDRVIAEAKSLFQP